MKLRYELNLAGDANSQTGGCTDLPGAIPLLLKESGILQGGTGYLYKEDEPQAQLCLAACDQPGLFLGITIGENVFLSCANADDLAETVDVRGDDLHVSRGLFIPVGTALTAIRYFAETGQCDPAVKWITPDELPDEGNYII